MEVRQHPPGTFCWSELATSDQANAKDFYATLFGWTPEDMPIQGGVYTQFLKNGKRVCSCYTMMPEMQSPPHWGNYVSVVNAEETASKAAELGGKILAPPMQVMEHGRLAMISDPVGAAFSIWQPQAHIGAQLINEPGTTRWQELYTSDGPRSIEFYTKLFGWTADTNPSPSGIGDYTEFNLGDRAAAGMLEIQPHMGKMPPHWNIYFAVEECDSTIDKCLAAGGEIQFPAMDITGIGRIAFLSDRQNVAFGIVELLPGAMG